MPPPKEDADRVTLDVPGAILLAVALAALLLAITRGAAWGWASLPVLGCLVMGAVALATWGVVETRRPSPLVDLRLTCSPGVLGANLAALLLGFAMFAGASGAILLMQRPPSDGLGLGLTVFQTGLVMTPMALASLVSPPVARWLVHRIGVRRVLPSGAVLVAASFGLYGLLHDEVWHAVLMMAVMGLGVGVTYSVIPAIIVARAPMERTASATGTNQVLRLLGGAFGAAVTAAVLAWATPLGATSPQEVGYVVAAAVATGMGLATALVGWLMVPSGLSEATAVDTSGPST